MNTQSNPLSIKQVELLNTVAKNNSMHINDFVRLRTNGKHETPETLKHKDLFFIMSNVNLYNLRYTIETETDDYIIGTQTHIKDNKTLRIISFKSLMILDYDNCTIKEVEEKLFKFPYTFLVYKTFNGFHCYNITREFDYKDKNTLKLMSEMKCDDWYIQFTSKIGFVTRLERKFDRKEEYIEKFIKIINDYPVNDKLLNLVEFKDTLLV